MEMGKRWGWRVRDTYRQQQEEGEQRERLDKVRDTGGWGWGWGGREGGVGRNGLCSDNSRRKGSTWREWTKWGPEGKGGVRRLI